MDIPSFGARIDHWGRAGVQRIRWGSSELSMPTTGGMKAARPVSFISWTRAPVRLHFLDATCAAFVRGSTVYWYPAPSPDPPLARVRRQPRHRALPLPYGGASQSPLHQCLCYETLCAMPR
jgi:hypothetical protein